MKTKLQIIGIALLGFIVTSCSSSMHMSNSSVTPTDDIYYTPSKTNALASNSQQSVINNSKGSSTPSIEQLEKKYNQIIASDTGKIDTLIYKAESTNPYYRILSDTYQDSYERRLRGMQDPMYGMENYYDSYFNRDYIYASAFDPYSYHTVVMGNQVWVEPWSISAMFTTRLPWDYWLSFNFGYRVWYSNNFWYENYYYNPYYLNNSCYENWNNGHNYDYYGRRNGNSTNITSFNKHTEGTYENQILSSRKRGDLTSESAIRNPNIRTRDNNFMDVVSRNNQNVTKDVTNRGDRNIDLNTTRLRGETSTRNINMTEPTRKSNSNTYQRPRSTNNEGYIRTATRNQTTNNGVTSRDNSTRNSSTIRESRNVSPTYNRPNRVETSNERSRTTTNSSNTSRESTYSGSQNSNNTSSGVRQERSTNSSSSSPRTQNNNSNNSSSSGSARRR